MKITKLALAWALLAAAGAWAADTVTKQVTGEAAIINNDKIRAKDDAKKAALREAVEQVAGTMISASTITQNSQLMSDRIFSNSQGYVKSYEIVGQPVEEAGVMKVTVKAVVSTVQLDQDLQRVQGLIQRLENRKLVILTQEQSIDTSATIFSSQVLATELTKQFKTDGWTIIDPNFAAGKVKLSAGIGPAEAKEIGDLSKADYILYGNVNYRYQSTKGTMIEGSFPVTGEYDLTVFACDSGSQVTKMVGKISMDEVKKPQVLSYERTAFEITQAHVPVILKEVRGKLVDYLSSGEQNGKRVVVNVLGLREYGAVQDFKKVLQESVAGVSGDVKASYKSGKAEFDFNFVGTTDDFANRVGNKRDKTLKPWGIRVTGVTGNTVELTLAK